MQIEVEKEVTLRFTFSSVETDVDLHNEFLVMGISSGVLEMGTDVLLEIETMAYVFQEMGSVACGFQEMGTVACAFLEALIEACPYRLHTILTDNVLRSEEGRLARQQVSVREHAPAVCLSSTSIQAAPADPEELSAIANTGSSRRASRRGPHRPQHEMSIQAGDPSIIYRVVVLTPSRLC